MKTIHKIYIDDARYRLPLLYEDYKEKVALLVTSPPYFVGRAYEDYLANEPEYWKMLQNVFESARTLIEPHGKIAVNFADRYANKALTGRVEEVLYAYEYDYIMQNMGFVLWTRIIWRKEYTIGEDCKHVLSPPNKYGHMRVSPNWEYIFVWKKESPGKYPVKDVDMSKEEWAKWVDGVWVIPSVRKNVKIDGMKVARFPPELPRRLIKMYTQPGDTVADPFVGTGTTCQEARKLQRNSIGIEIHKEAIPIIKETMGFVDDYVYKEDIFGNGIDIDIIQ